MDETNRFAEILLPMGDQNLDKTLTYQIPPALEHLAIGDPVLVPFRKGTATGYVVSFSQASDRPTKCILEKHRSLASLSPDILDFSKWLSDRYLAPWWESTRGFSLVKTAAQQESPPISPEPLPRLDLNAEQAQAAGAI